MRKKLNKSIDVSEEIYLLLVDKKFKIRARSIDEVLRKDNGLPSLHEEVQRYSFER